MLIFLPRIISLIRFRSCEFCQEVLILSLRRFDGFSGTCVDLRHKDHPRLLSRVLLFFVALSPPDMMVYLFVYLLIVSLPTGLWAS